MERKDFGPKPYILPMPVLVVGSYDANNNPDAMNVAYAGIVNSEHIQINIGAAHKTAENIKLNKAFTVSFATVETMALADYCGIVSAKDNPDKLKDAGMSVFRSMIVDAPILEDFPVCLECLVEEISEMGHTLKIVGKILNTAVEPSVLDDNGQIDPQKLHVISFDPVQKNYIALGETVGKAFSIGKTIKDN